MAAQVKVLSSFWIFSGTSCASPSPPRYQKLRRNRGEISAVAPTTTSRRDTGYRNSTTKCPTAEQPTRFVFSVEKPFPRLLPAYLSRTAGTSVSRTHSRQVAVATSTSASVATTGSLIPPCLSTAPFSIGTHRPPILSSAWDTSGHMVGL